MTRSIEDADGFAQVFPEHKFHIVDVLQKHGHIVGMTGDGVNDAPALKKADCGFAVSGATDAARAAASIVLVAPGLSVIIDAIKESRKIFQRMNSYAMYRIAETLRVLLFMTLAIVVFNFYPLTAIMIVMLALLNDGAILSIAYDNVIYRDQPEAWNMRVVLGIATVLGLVGPIASFGLFFLGDRVLHIDRPQIQTMMYLLLSVAGHLTIFQTRTRGPWWSIRPAWILLTAVVGTQVLATIICVFGFLVAPPLVGLGGDGLGICAGLVPANRPGEAACLPSSRSRRGWKERFSGRSIPGVSRTGAGRSAMRAADPVTIALRPLRSIFMLYCHRFFGPAG
jgi:H+-transporting ATPase